LSMPLSQLDHAQGDPLLAPRESVIVSMLSGAKPSL
jgi:hypothetical protein